MKKHLILEWDKDPIQQDTPLLVVGERFRGTKPEKGMKILYLESGLMLRVDDFSFRNEKNERNGIYDLNTTVIKLDGTDGAQNIIPSVNAYLAIRTASISSEHQHLFRGGQMVEGEIKNGYFVPAPEYLVDWHARFEKYFLIKNELSSDRGSRLIRKLLWSTIEEIGHPRFNEFIRDYFVREKNEDITFAAAHKAMRQSGPISMHDQRKSFAEDVLYIAIQMGNDFWEAVKVVVYEEGIKVDLK